MNSCARTEREAHDAAALALQYWGEDGHWTRLPGENFNATNGVSVLKLTPVADDLVQLEQELLGRWSAAGLPVVQAVPTLDGSDSVACQWDGQSMTARLYPRLPGSMWRTSPTTDALLCSIGATLAQMHQVDLGAQAAQRTHAWDLATACLHRPSIGLMPSSSTRRGVDAAMQAMAAIDLDGCPRGVLHGDFNDENVLVDGDAVVGIVDFGDVLAGAFVQDLAITMAYAVQQDGVDVQRAGVLVQAYEATRALNMQEKKALPVLVAARLAMSLCIAASRQQKDPSHPTWFEHVESTSQALEKLMSFAPRDLGMLWCSGQSRTSPSATSADSLLDRRACLGRSLSLGYDQPLHITQGRGAYLIDADDRVYLDLVNNVCHVGHSHPRVVEAMARQAYTLNTNTRYLHETVLEYAERLTSTLPKGLDTCFFVNSGSEANELALRIARVVTGHQDVLVIDGAYHGNTGNCVAMSPYKFNGLGGSGCPEWVHVAPMPDVYRGDWSGEDAGHRYASEAGAVIAHAVESGRSIAAFFAESMLSCGGQIPLPSGYLQETVAHVRAAGGLYVADEVQVGFGRVGTSMWGFEKEPVLPDMVVLGKPMGNGHPIGAVVTTRAIANAFANGMEYFSTFGGNPVSAAVGLAVLDVIDSEGLMERAQVLGQRLMEGLHALREDCDLIGDVRGQGLFVGIELVRDRNTKQPAAAEAHQVVNAAKHAGILLSTDGPQHNVIKIKPPLALDAMDVDRALRTLRDVLVSR